MNLTARDWPTHLDFQEALVNTAICFDDAALKQGDVRKNGLGFPLAATGGFASVYQVTKNGQKWAVRCFTSPIASDAQQRVALISEHLRTSRLPYTVDFSFDAAGIRVGGKSYPTVKMEWIDALSLNRYVNQLAVARNRGGFTGLAARWQEMIHKLGTSSVAHGDLQHGNVLVTAAGELRLVDYDGMFVPALHGKKATELGQPSYQHPERHTSFFNADLDRYAALTIFTALHALAVDPGLWDAFDNDDNMLFVSDDHRDPTSSRLFARLLTMPSPVDRLSTALANAASAPAPSAVPTLSEALAYSSPLLLRPSTSADHHGGLSSRSWFLDAAAAESSAPLGGGVLSSWSPDLHPVWSRPGAHVVRWTEQEPVYQTITRRDTQIRYPVRRLFRRTEVVVERQEKVQNGTRPVPKHRVEHKGGGPALKGLAVSGSLAYGLADARLAVWTMAEETSRPNDLGLHLEVPEGIASDGGLVAIVDRSGITILDAASQRRRISRDGDSRFYDVAVSSDGRLIAAGLGRQAANVYNATSGTLVKRFDGFRRRVRAVAFVGHDRLLAGSDDSTVALFDIKSRRRVKTAAVHVDEITVVAADRAGTVLASADAAGDIHFYDKNLRDLGSVHMRSRVQAALFAPDGQHLVVATCDGPVSVIEVRSRRTVATLTAGPGAAQPAAGLAFANDGDLVTGHETGLIIRWSNHSSKPAIDLSAIRAKSPRASQPRRSNSRPPPSRAARSRGPRSPTSTATPNCPTCGRTMVPRRRNSAPYNRFWGCPSFPRCRGTRNM
jgi:hypothetical protein